MIRSILVGFTLASFAISASPASAQVVVEPPLGGSAVTTYDVVTPGSKQVTFGEKIKVRHRFGKTITVEKPVRYVTRTPPVVQETRVIRPAPIVENVVVQPEPVLESYWTQPAPILEQRYVQPAPIVRPRVFQPEPVVQTRYLGTRP